MTVSLEKEAISFEDYNVNIINCLELANTLNKNNRNSL